MPTSVIEHIRKVVGDGLRDGELLGRYVDRRDEAALAALVNRHGPMVWGVCRRQLSYHDAEDAFQATFIVLVRKASSIAQREAVGNWLYGVAYQTALQARRGTARRRAREVQVTEMPDVEAPQDQWADMRPVMDEELSRLPDHYRTVIVLCELEGRSRREVARLLDCPEGTVASRLARAREMLAKRLAGRGVASGAVSMVVVGAPAAVTASTIRSALAASAGLPLSGLVSARVVTLSGEVMNAMFLSKSKTVLVGLMIGLVCCAPGLTVLRSQEAVAGSVTAADKASGNKGDEKPKSVADLLRDRPDVRQAERELMAAGLDVEVARTRFFPKGGKPGYRAFDPKYLSFPPNVGDWTVPTVNKGAIRAEYTSASAAQVESLDNYLRIILAAYPEVLGRGALVKEPVKQEEKTAWDKEVDGLQMGLALKDTHTVRQGEKLKPEVRLRNVGKAEIKVTHGLLRESPPQMTAGGREMPVTMPLGSRDKVRATERVIKPGEMIVLYSPEVAVQSVQMLWTDGGWKVDVPTAFLEPGQYRIAFSGMLTSHPKLTTGTVEFEVKPARVTAWGEEVDGVQVGIQFDEDRAYKVGEAVTLIVRLRNNGKKDVPYLLHEEYFLKNPPLITDADGKAVKIKELNIFGIIKKGSAAPGKEVDLCRLRLELRPGTDRKKEEPWTLYGTGKFYIQYKDVPVVGEPRLEAPATTHATGKLELEVKEGDDKKSVEPPAQKEKESRSEYPTADIVVQYRDESGREVRDLKRFRVDDAEAVAKLASHFPGILGDKGSGPRTFAGKRATLTIKFNHKSGEVSRLRVAHVTSDYATWQWRDNTPYTGDRKVEGKDQLQALMERLAAKNKVELK